jgi:hypothetical protein
MTDRQIVIPTEVEHTKILSCIVEPPYDKMTIDLCEVGSTEPFLRGGIAGRRCPSIDAFIKRPQKLNMKTKQRDPPLKAGDKIDVIVTLYNKVEQPKVRTDKPKFSEPIQSVKETVTIT